MRALEGDLEQLRADNSLAVRLAGARKLLDDLRRQSDGFASARIRQLTVRREQLAAEAELAADKAQEAALTARRSAKLADKGAGSEVRMEEAQIEASIASHAEVAAQKQVEAADIEIDALKRGIFVGDSYNDRPQSFQRAGEVEREVEDLSASQAQLEIRIVRQQALLNEERARYDLQAKAEIALPRRTLIYEILTAPGERVQKGQDLLRLLDCSGAVVTAVVEESVYNKLRIGAPARFLPRGGAAELTGRVIGLTGAAAAPANFAIQPSALSRGAFHVTVDVPGLAGQDGCAVGRTGRVIFDSPAGAAAAPL